MIYTVDSLGFGGPNTVYIISFKKFIANSYFRLYKGLLQDQQTDEKCLNCIDELYVNLLTVQNITNYFEVVATQCIALLCKIKL